MPYIKEQQPRFQDLSFGAKGEVLGMRLKNLKKNISTNNEGHDLASFIVILAAMQERTWCRIRFIFEWENLSECLDKINKNNLLAL